MGPLICARIIDARNGYFMPRTLPVVVMTNSAPTSPMQRGFTLIELLVVLLVLGIAAGGVSLAVESSRTHDPQRAVEQLRLSLEAAAAQARIRGRRIAVELVPDGYRFVELDRNGEWRRVTDDPVLRDRILPDGVRWMSFGAGTQSTRDTDKLPQRRIEFSTRAPRFRLQLSHAGAVHTLESDLSGLVKLDTKAATSAIR